MGFLSGELTGAVLSQATFDGSNFFDTCLSSSDLMGAELAHVTFEPGSGICGTDFSGSNLTYTTFSGTATSNCACGGRGAGPPVFIGAVLSQGSEGDMGVSSTASTSRANFVNMEMTGSSFVNCTLAGANLAGADLYLSTFRGSNLNGADLSLATIASAEASYASMVGISGVGVVFSASDLTGADLTGAV